MSPHGLDPISDIEVVGVTRVLLDKDPGVVIETDEMLDVVYIDFCGGVRSSLMLMYDGVCAGAGVAL